VGRSEVTNVPASVRARLLNLSREGEESFDQLLVYYAIERFLFRLSRTEWGDRFVVKGAAMLRAWGVPLGRPTRDIDFLGRIDNSPEAVTAAVQECLAVDYPDGLVFEDAVTTSEIIVADRYPGIRVLVKGNLDGAKFNLKLDVGVDDAVVPDPEWVDYPTLLDFDAPRIRAYLPATAIAEKFEAIVRLGAANTRMKDFYDIWLLARTHEFAGSELTSAIRATFNHRNTDIPGGRPVALTADFFEDAAVQAQWDAFLSKSGAEAPARLADVCGAVADFVTPAAAAAAEGKVLEESWTPGAGWSSS
jgi:hypothetical protein